MGGGSQQSTQTTQQILSPEQQQLLNMAMPFATQYAQNQPKLPDTSSVAGFTDPQKAGQAQTLQAAGGDVANTANTAAGGYNFLASGAALDPNSNPALKSAIQGATLPMQQNFQDTVIPSIRGAGTAAGPLGSREGVAEGIAGRGEEQAEGAVTSGMENTAYQTGIDAMTKALGLAPTIQQSELEPGAATSAVGDVQQQLEQQQLTEAFNKFMFPQTQPLSTAESLAGIAAGIPGGGSTTTGQINSNLSPIQQAMGFGSLGASLFGSGGMFGGGSAGGGAFANLLPWLAAPVGA